MLSQICCLLFGLCGTGGGWLDSWIKVKLAPYDLSFKLLLLRITTFVSFFLLDCFDLLWQKFLSNMLLAREMVGWVEGLLWIKNQNYLTFNLNLQCRVTNFAVILLYSFLSSATPFNSMKMSSRLVK